MEKPPHPDPQYRVAADKFTALMVLAECLPPRDIFYPTPPNWGAVRSMLPKSICRINIFSARRARSR